MVNKKNFAKITDYFLFCQQIVLLVKQNLIKASKFFPPGHIIAKLFSVYVTEVSFCVM